MLYDTSILDTRTADTNRARTSSSSSAPLRGTQPDVHRRGWISIALLVVLLCGAAAYRWLGT